jgi:hypothetical protein
VEETWGREAYVHELERTKSTGWMGSWGVRKAGGGRGEIETDAVDGDSYELHAGARFGGVEDMQCDDLEVGRAYCGGCGGLLLSRLVQVGEGLYVLNYFVRGEMIEGDDVFGGKSVQAIAFVVGDDGDDAV